MQTFVLGDPAMQMTIGGLIQQAASGGVEVQDSAGNVVAYVLPPKDREAWAYAEARVYFENHRDEFRAARERSGGITTAELLAKAAAAVSEAASP